MRAQAELSRALAESADTWSLLEAAVCQRLASLPDSAPPAPTIPPLPPPPAAGRLGGASESLVSLTLSADTGVGLSQRARLIH